MITFSARISTTPGTVKSRLLAVFRLIIRSKFRRLLYGQIGRLTPFQNLVNRSSDVSAVGSKARSVGHKTPGVYELSPSVDRRQPIFCRQVYDPLLIRVGQWVQCHRESRKPKIIFLDIRTVYAAHDRLSRTFVRCSDFEASQRGAKRS